MFTLKPVARIEVPRARGFTWSMWVTIALLAGWETAWAGNPGCAPMVTRGPQETARTDQKQLDHLPFNGRDFKDFLRLVPNIFPARSPTANRFGNSVSIGGQRTSDTLVNLDEMDFTSPFLGVPASASRSPFPISLDSVQSFRVIITGGAAAEFGRTTSGVINLHTNTGTNEVHTTGFWFSQPQSLTPRDGFNRKPTGFRHIQFGGNLGGPLVRDRLFGFAAVESQQRQNHLVTSFGPGLETFLPNLQGKTAARQEALTFVSRFDLNANPHQFTYRINYDRFELIHGGGGNALGIGLDHFGTEQPVIQAHAGRWGWVVTPFTFNELRFQYLRESQPELPANSGPEVQILKEGLVFGPKLRQNVPVNLNQRFQISDLVMRTVNHHTFKFGTDLILTRIKGSFQGGGQGGYGYASVADFPSQPLFYFQVVGAGGLGLEEATGLKARQQEFAFYAQDYWRTRPNLTLNFGLRWDGTRNPRPARPNPRFPATATIPHDLNNFAPRLSLAYDPRNRGKQVVRADFGLNYGRLPAFYLVPAFTTTGVTNSARFFFKNVPVTFPQTLPATIPGTPVGSDVFFFDRDFALTRARVVNVSFEQQVATKNSVLVRFTASRTRNVPFLQNLNLTGGSLDGQGRFVYQSGPPPFPDFGRIFNLTSRGYDEYRALTVGFQRRVGAGTLWQAYYTYSRTKDTLSQERPLFEVAAGNQFDPAYDFATSARDIRHRLVMNGLFRWRYGIWLSGILTALSGRPIDEVTGEDLNHDRNPGNDRVLGPDGQVRQRNSQRTPPFFTLDLRISKTVYFRLNRTTIEVLAEGFNLFQTQNLTSNGTTNDGFAVVRRDTPAGPNSLLNDAGTPRQVQFGIRVRF